MSVNWSTGNYSPSELSNKIEHEGGLAEFVTNYLDIDSLPKELQPVAASLIAAYVNCERVFKDAGVSV